MLFATGESTYAYDQPGGGPCVALGCAAAGDVLPAFAFLDRADGAFLQLTARAEGVS